MVTVQVCWPHSGPHVLQDGVPLASVSVPSRCAAPPPALTQHCESLGVGDSAEGEMVPL